MGLGDKVCSGVGDGGAACFADQPQIAPFAQGLQQGGDFALGGVFVERLQVEFANGGGDTHVFEMGAGGFFGFYDKVGEMGDLGLLVGQQAGGVGGAEWGGD